METTIKMHKGLYLVISLIIVALFIVQPLMNDNINSNHSNGVRTSMQYPTIQNSNNHFEIFDGCPNVGCGGGWNSTNGTNP